MILIRIGMKIINICKLNVKIDNCGGNYNKFQDFFQDSEMVHIENCLEKWNINVHISIFKYYIKYKSKK